MAVLAEWTLNATSRAVARAAGAAGVDIEAEHEKFLAYPRTEPLHDPDKAFQGWLERAIGYVAKGKLKAQAQPSEVQQTRTTDVERELAEIRAFEASNPAEYERLRKYMEQHRWWEGAARSFQIQQMLGAIHDRDMIFAFLEDEGREF